jgi:hypothetical protein
MCTDLSVLLAELIELHLQSSRSTQNVTGRGERARESPKNTTQSSTVSGSSKEEEERERERERMREKGRGIG